MPMDEDAMFKALLKNKPQPKPQAPAVKEAKETFQPAQPAYASKGSEDAMYKALLHNRPTAQVSKPPARVEPEPMLAAPKVEPVYYEPHIVTQSSQPPVVSLEPVIEPIKNLTASVNQVQTLLKTVFMVLVLTLLVGLAILIKINL